MRRTQENTDITRHFTGIQEVGAEFGNRIDEIHGMYDKPMTSLTRIPGKLLTTTGIAAGPIWGLHWLRFQDSILMLSHEGPDLVAGREYPLYTGQMYPIPEFSDTIYYFPGSTEGPYIDWADWPSIIDQPEWEDHRESETSVVPSRIPPEYDYSVALVPSSLDFIQTHGWSALDEQIFELIIAGTFPPLTISQGPITGLIIAGIGYVSGNSIYRPDPQASSIQQTYKVGVSAYTLAPGYYTSLVPYDIIENEGFLHHAAAKTVHLTVNCLVLEPPELIVSPSDIQIDLIETEVNEFIRTITITGQYLYDKTVEWAAFLYCPAAIADYVSLDVNSGSISAGDINFINVTISTDAGFPTGVFPCTIVVRGGTTPRTVNLNIRCDNFANYPAFIAYDVSVQVHPPNPPLVARPASAMSKYGSGTFHYKNGGGDTRYLSRVEGGWVTGVQGPIGLPFCVGYKSEQEKVTMIYNPVGPDLTSDGIIYSTNTIPDIPFPPVHRFGAPIEMEMP